MKTLYLSIIIPCLIIGFTTLDAFSESYTTVPYSVHQINDTAFAVTGVINKTSENALVTLEIKNNSNNTPIFVAQTIPVAGNNFTFIVPKIGPLWQNVKDYSVIVNYMNSSALQDNFLASSNASQGTFLDVIKVPNSLQSPLKQFQHGIKAQDVKCHSNLQLIFKSDDKSPACVLPTHASVLVERGWAIEKLDPMFTNMKVQVYDSYNPGTLSGHFLKGSLDSIDGPISNGIISITVNDIFMGNTITDPLGCFQFNSWNDTKLLAQINQSRTIAEQKGVLDAMDLKVSANYLGDENHHAANATMPSSLNLWALPLPPPNYQTSIFPSMLNVTQGNSIHFELTVKPTTTYSQVNKMMLSTDRMPCGMTSTISHSERNDNVSLDRPGIFNVTLNTSGYTPVGTYWMMIIQDTSGLSNPNIDHDITMLPIKVISKDSHMK